MDDEDDIVTAIRFSSHEAPDHLAESTLNWLACGYCVLQKDSELWMYTFFITYLYKQIVKSQISMTIDVHLCIIASVWKTDRKKHTGEIHNWEAEGPSSKELIELEKETNKDTEAEKEVLFSRHQKGHCKRNDQGHLPQSVDFTNINGVFEDHIPSRK